jgi:hypothetical protein
MDDVILCPFCGKPNPTDSDTCQFCNSNLKLEDTKSIPVGQEPVRKDNPKLENRKPSSVDKIQPGEAPTPKNTGDLEKELPSWLRSVRETNTSNASETGTNKSSDQGMPIDSGQGESADWLSGLGKAATNEENEIPDWLTDLRGDKTAPPSMETAPTSGVDANEDENPFAGFGLTGRLSRIGNEPPGKEQDTSAPHAEAPEQPAPDELPKGLSDWMNSTQAQPGGSLENPAAIPAGEETLDWLETFNSETPTGNTGENPPANQSEAGTLDWLAGLPGILDESSPTKSTDSGAVPVENSPDSSNIFKGDTGNVDTPPVEANNQENKDETAPDWLSDVGPSSEISGGENIPDWLSSLEAKAGPATGLSAVPASSEPAPSGSTRKELPDWLSQFQADINSAAEQESKKEQFETAPPSQERSSGSASIPDWLAGLKPSTTEPSDGTPALIANSDSNIPGDGNDKAFSMETPDWLSKINPEQSGEKPFQGDASGPTTDNPDVSELPSWVQAMRPVEAVVGEAGPAQQETNVVPEQAGPLAGLSGVLPVGPGLGQLSKPPAYAVKLQASDGQQRYAAALERLITSETQPREIKSTRIVSNRLWRWLISIFLILAVAFPLFTGIPITQATQLKAPELINAFTVIGNLPSNAPVLVVFDYDAALSGELEAAAAPLIDHLLFQGPRLTIISTSPTGPALAERLLHDVNVSPLVAGHNYLANQQYVNLGFLAGGASGVQYFSTSPSKAAPYTLNGQPAWQLPPLQGINKLNDFSALLILTDNAETGRVWIEQTSTTIGATPLLMVVSAQAEPMLLPYFDSGQIKGMVTGLAGGEAYSQTFLRPDGQKEFVQNYWNSFSSGIVVAEILIVLGALWSSFAGWSARRNKGKGAA